MGNGQLLVCLDAHGAIRDLFYPRVGHPNHLNGYAIRMGLWVDGQFDWCDSDRWKRSQSMAPGTMIGVTTLEHPQLKVHLLVEEGVSPKQPVFLRRVRVENRRPYPVAVRLFFTHDLRIEGSDVGDTAFYNPFVQGVVHYKGPHYFLFGGLTPKAGVQQYATGIKAFGGFEGTWRDAEDGQLSMNPIAQGSVDSTVGLEALVGSNATVDTWYWIVCGSNLDEIVNRHESLIRTGLPETLAEIERFWRAWANRRPPGFEALPREVRDLYTRSLLIMRTQIDNGGAILAANDTDIMATNRATYSYMWPRDGALVAWTLDRVGYQHLARKFFRFCAQILSHHDPILLQKYGPDGSLGASWHPWIYNGRPEVPFQEDGTALTLWAIWKHFQRHQDLEFLNELYESYILPTANFIERYRDPRTGLPLPSWDLWEERRGVHAHTTAAVIAALRAVASITHALGGVGAERFATAAEEMTAGLREHMVDPQRGVLVRQLVPVQDGQYRMDLTADAAVLAVPLFEALPIDDPVVAKTIADIESRLTVKSDVGGLARYEGDYYFRRTDRYPGNPWIICTLWLAKCKLMAACCRADLASPLATLEWVARHAAPTGALGEQLHPETGETLSVSPLTWSHAEFVDCVLDYLERERSLSDSEAASKVSRSSRSSSESRS